MIGARGAILSIQSQVAYGHVGNSAAVLPLQRLGFDVFPLNTVQLAHHPGYGVWRGHTLRPEQLLEILAGLEERGVLARCVAVLSGYLGDAGVAEVVVRAVAAVRAAHAGAPYFCDPVIGDDEPGVFVGAGVPEAIRERLVPLADIVVPNGFELAHLTGRPIETLDDALADALADHQDRGGVHDGRAVVHGLSARREPSLKAASAELVGPGRGGLCRPGLLEAAPRREGCPMRSARVSRRTAETDVAVSLALDGTGRAEVATGVGFLDHMLELFARHALFDLEVKVTGDLQVDDHHTTEDCGIALGQAFAQALGDKKRHRRYADIHLPMDETLTRVALDISGPALPRLPHRLHGREDRRRSTPSWCASGSRPSP